MESVAQSIVSKFGQVIVDELKEIHGVGDKVVHLRDELATMNAVLRVISEAEQEKVDHIVREWEKQVHDLVYDAEDCTDIYSLRIIRPIPLLTAEDISGTRLTFWPRYLFARAKRSLRYRYEKVVLQRTLAADINALLARTTIVSERRARYGIDGVALPRSACFTVQGSVSSVAFLPADDPNQVVGLEGQLYPLVDKIKATVDHEGLEVFCIVGFGGLGKTTLAMELCRLLEQDFPYQAMVSVSQAFNGEKDINRLLVRVIQQILKGKPNEKTTIREEEDEGTGADGNEFRIEEMDVEGLSNKIKVLLNRYRCLVVLDDVWSLRAWEAIRTRLPENNCCSRIIVTTRIGGVAKAVGVGKKLFVKRAFGSMGDCPRRLELYMDTILRKCGGVPLAIISIANLLASYGLTEGTLMWERVSRSIDFRMQDYPTPEGMKQLLTFIYDHLPRHLKACMMYMSILPEGYVIAKDRLLYRWVAEGLATGKRGLSKLEVAEEYLNELVSRNMIQLENFVCIEDPYHREVEIEGCRMHDMILEAMVSKSEESNFVSLVGQQYKETTHGHDKVRRLSLHGNDHDEQQHVVHGIEAMKVQHVRSLSTFQHYGMGLGKLLNRLGEFKLLRVLDLEDCKALQDEHMRDVCGLYLLRFLSLRGTNVSVMPHKVGNLEHLETLDIRNTGIERRLPRTVTKLSKIERLRSNEWLLPRGLGNMKALHEVENGVITGDDVKVAQEISKLQQLVALSIRIENQHEQEDLLCELASSLSKTCALESLHLDCPGGTLDFLREVSPPPPLLQCLSMFGFISKLPGWIRSLRHLTKFELGRTELDGNQLFDVLCRLPNLQSVLLLENRYRDPEMVARTAHCFPVLRILEVSSCPTLTALIFEEETMPMLEVLVLSFGNEEMRLVGVENLKSLKQVKLRGKEGNPAMKGAVEELKTHSTEAHQIKVVVDFN